MNVKQFQAGQRGICPRCGAKMQIPTASTRQSSRRRSETVPATDRAPALADPFEQAGDAVWYVQPPEGEQLGPASARSVRQWLTEGRLAADYLVWHEGWDDWKKAGSIFPQFATRDNPVETTARLSANLTIPGLEDYFSVQDELLGRGRVLPSHSPPKQVQMLTLGILAFVVLILAVVLLTIWLMQS